MIKKNLTILHNIWYDVRVRMLLIIVFLGMVIYAVFAVISIHTNEITMHIARHLYISELKLLLAEKVIIAQGFVPTEEIKETKAYADLLLDKGVVFKYVSEIKNTRDKTEIMELNELFKLVEEAYATNDIPALQRLYIESLKFPDPDIYTTVLQQIQRGIAHIAIDQQIIFFTVLISLLISFFFLQFTGKRINIISASTKKILTENNQINASERIHLKSDDETAFIVFHLNQLMEILEKSASQSFVFIRQLLYNVVLMFKSSEGWALETQLMHHSTERISAQMNRQIDSVNHASAALEEMERTLDIIFNNISRQSSAMTQSAATLEEMGRQVEGVAKISADTAKLATNLTEFANKGNHAVDASIVSIRDVSEYSSQIIKLLRLITGIAKQTNLLAMNASIEAAHAGEAGQGFAIVAEEIRRLSETTNKNAKEIRTVVDTMVEKIENSVSQVQTAGEDLVQITEYAGNVEEKIGHLNQMMQEQNTATHEMITTIEGLVNLAQEIKLSMEEQQHGLHEYGTTIGNLKENFEETKSTLNGHMSTVENLLDILNDVGIRIRIQKDIMDNVSGFLQLYKIDDSLIVSDAVIKEGQDQLFLEKKQKH